MGKSDQHSQQNNGEHAHINTHSARSTGEGQIWDKYEKRLTATRGHAN